MTASSAIRGNLARWRGEAGDPAGAAARDQLAALLPIREPERGANHTNTMNERAPRLLDGEGRRRS